MHTFDITPLHESPPQKRSGMARVLKGSQFYLHTHMFICNAIGMSHTCLCLPNYSWYSFTDPGRMECWLGLGLCHSCGLILVGPIDIPATLGREKSWNVNSSCDRLFDDLSDQLLDGEDVWSHPVFSQIQTDILIVQCCVTLWRECSVDRVIKVVHLWKNTTKCGGKLSEMCCQ